MPKHETDLTVVEPQEGAASEDATLELSAAPAETEPPASRTEIEQLKGERDQLLDRLARLQAEFENARKRAERERVDFRDYATGNVVELIVKQMEEILRQLQVNPIPAVGEAFDPRVHEALGSVERDDMPDQHVAEEIRRGYKLRERLLRPALVRVAHNPNQKTD